MARATEGSDLAIGSRPVARATHPTPIGGSATGRGEELRTEAVTHEA